MRSACSPPPGCQIRYPEVRHIVNNISASIDALEALFNELLDVSKLDAGVILPLVPASR